MRGNIHMNKYCKYIELGFSDGLYYRTSNIMTFLSSFFIDYVKVAVWYAAVAFSAKRINSNLINDTLLYMILAAAISSIYRTQPSVSLSEAYVNGSLIHRRVYPISITISNFCDMLGRSLSRFIINVFPSLIILGWDFRPNWCILPQRIPMVCINIVLGLYLNYILFAVLDVLCFWLRDTSTLQKMKDIIFKFFSGSLFPLWFLSATLSQISNYLPFSKQLYSPVSYLMGTTISKVYFRDMKILFIYSVFGTVVVYLLWRKGIKRVESFGG